MTPTKSTLRSVRHLACAAAVATVFAAGSAQALCALPSERAALDTRALQSELMVAALSCDQASRYNAFVSRFRDHLVDRGRELRHYFRRIYGAAGEKRLNRFVTALANQASMRSVTTGADFCPTAARLFEQLARVQPNELDRLAGKPRFASAHGVQDCTPRPEMNAAALPEARGGRTIE